MWVGFGVVDSPGAGLSSSGYPLPFPRRQKLKHSFNHPFSLTYPLLVYE